MTKQTVELVYHDAATEKPEIGVSSVFSVEVLAYTFGTWAPVYYDPHNKRWVSLASGRSVNCTAWIDMPPKPKKKVWVKKEAHCVGHLGNIHGSEIDNVTFRVPGIARNIVCTYEIEEEQ